MHPSSRVKHRALELGLDLAGIAAAGPVTRPEAFARWLAEGHHADMDWIARDPERRTDPRLVLPGARSVVVVGYVYHLSEPPEAVWNDPLRGRVARYAWRRDYHKELEPKLRRLAEFIGTEHPGSTSRVYADTGPVMEHEWAVRAGLGFTGRNTLLIQPVRGSFLHLGVVLTSAELEPDEAADPAGTFVPLPRPDGRSARASCGSCRRCLDACPTSAFPAEYVLNSRLCIAYHTIENRGPIPAELRPRFQNWVFGCDACQSVCPYVKGALRAERDRWVEVSPDVMAPRLEEILSLADDAAFVRRFAGTPVIRAKRRGLVRNALVALGNSGRPEAAGLARAVQARETDPMLAEHAAWAARRLEEG